MFQRVTKILIIFGFKMYLNNQINQDRTSLSGTCMFTMFVIISEKHYNKGKGAIINGELFLTVTHPSPTPSFSSVASVININQKICNVHSFRKIALGI